MCSVFGSRLQLIKHVEIIYIKPIYLSVGVIKSRSGLFFSVLFQIVCFFVCMFLLKFMIADWLGWFRRRVFHVSEK